MTAHFPAWQRHCNKRLQWITQVYWPKISPELCKCSPYVSKINNLSTRLQHNESVECIFISYIFLMIYKSYISSFTLYYLMVLLFLLRLIFLVPQLVPAGHLVQPLLKHKNMDIAFLLLKKSFKQFWKNNYIVYITL